MIYSNLYASQLSFLFSSYYNKVIIYPGKVCNFSGAYHNVSFLIMLFYFCTLSLLLIVFLFLLCLFSQIILPKAPSFFFFSLFLLSFCYFFVSFSKAKPKLAHPLLYICCIGDKSAEISLCLWSTQIHAVSSLSAASICIEPHL